MPSTLYLDRDVAGPSDPLIVTLRDGSLDFQVARNRLGFYLRDPSAPTFMARYYRFPDVTILARDRAELRIREVGQGSPNRIPAGTYELIGSVPGYWEASGDRLLRVTPSSQTAPRLSFIQQSALRVSALRLAWRLLPFTVPLRVRWLNAMLRLATVRLLTALGVPQLAGVGPVPATPAPAARGTRPYLRPFADASIGFERMYEDVTKDAEKFLDVASWGLDDEVRLSERGQRNPAYQAHALFRSAASRISRLAERQAGAAPLRDLEPPVRILVWEATLDDDYEPPGNDLSRLAVTWQPFTGPRGVGRLNVDQLADELRLAGDSGASRRVLGLFHTAYQALRDPLGDLPYPSGVLALVHNHPDHSVVGSHHLKFSVSERRAYVGGLNLLKEYWDRPDHRASDPDRDTSRGAGSGGSAAAGPLHDTGSILADEAVQRRLHGLFADLWNDAIRHESAFEGLKNALWRAQHQGSWRDRGVYSRLRDDLDRIDTSVSIRHRNAPHQPATIPAHDVNQLEVTLTLPRGSVWGPLTETDQRYRRSIESTAGASDTIYIESQYFPDRRQSQAIHRAWVASGRGNMRGAIHSDQDLLEFPPFAHIVIPYKPSTSPFDVSFLRESDFDAFLAGEFRNLRWLEIKTMRLIRTLSGDEWQRTYTLTSQSRVSMPGGADADPAYLDDDTAVTITNVEEYGTRQPVSQVTLEVEEFLPEGDVSVYTVAASDGTLPTGPTAQERQREYLEDHGIYVHSKAAIFLRDGGAGHEATVGSANLNARSLRAESLEPDTEANVWWAHDESIERWYNALLAEHTGMFVPSTGVISGHAVRSSAFEQLNLVRAGRRPLQHLIKLDLADRWNHLD